MNPQSVAVRVAYAQFWIRDAWLSRGDGPASGIPEATWKAYRWRLNRARTYLDQVTSGDDPHLYYMRVEVAKWLCDKATIEMNFEAGTKRFPNYFHYYSQRASLMQESWYGRPGELQAYAQSLRAKPGGDNGLIAYSYVTWEMVKFIGGKKAMQEGFLQWPSIRDSYAARAKHYGLRNRDWNILCSLAVTAGDRPTARIALAQIGTDWSSNAWRDQKEFNKWAEWIQSGEPQPSKK